MTIGNHDKKPEGSETAKNQSQEKNDESQPTVPSASSKPNTPISTEGQTGTYEEKNYRLAKRQFIVATITLIVVFAYTSIAAYEGRQMKQATDAAKKSANDADAHFSLDERAWIAVGVANGTLFEGKPLYISTRIMNNGRTPARKVTGDFIVEMVSPSAKPEFLYEGRHRFHLPEVTVMPNAPIDFPVYGVSQDKKYPIGKPSPEIIYTHEMRIQVEKGSRIIVMYGRVTYEDVFGGRHWVNFCTLGGPEKFGGADVANIFATGCDGYNNSEESQLPFKK